VDGAGIGSCMAANKVPGIRAAMCYDEATAVNSREHNAANVLTLGAGLIESADRRDLASHAFRRRAPRAARGEDHGYRASVPDEMSVSTGVLDPAGSLWR
jgi:ribose 5-phosphate isomerase RpiB